MLYFPNHINIETSDYCNRRCSYCPIQRDRDNAPARYLELALFERLCLELADAPHRLKISLQWIDEPLTNPRFFDYAELGRRLVPDAEWLLQTNGDFLDDKSAARIDALFDAVASKVYSEGLMRRLDALGLDVERVAGSDRIQSPGHFSAGGAKARGSTRALWHFNPKFRDATWVQHFDEEVMPPNATCARLWVQAAIGHDGKVFICCRDNLKAHPVGDLREASLFEAYNAAEARRVRRLMESQRRDCIDMCRTCPGAYAEPFDVLVDTQLEPLLKHRRSPGSPATVEAALALRPEGDLRPPRSRDLPVVDVAAPVSAHTRATASVVEDKEGRGPVETAPEQLPWGAYDYWTARQVAVRLGHLRLPGFLPRRYEVVVGLTPALARSIVDITRATVGEGLVAIWVCGSRVVTRPQLALIDPSVFALEDGLSIAGKSRVREFGDDPRLSSDLDLKILVDETIVDERTARRLGERLGLALERESRFIPLSGHTRPQQTLIRVPAGQAGDARAAFAWYNRSRRDLLGKCELSLEYVQLLHDRAAARGLLEEDATLSVRSSLVEGSASMRASIATLAIPDAVVADEGALLRTEHAGLTIHQLIGALADFPDLEPPGVIVDEHGRVLNGAAAVVAARRAGRVEVRIESPPLGHR